MNRLRKVSSIELSMAHYGTIVTAFTLSGIINIELLQQAIAIEAKRHPLLNAHIICQDGNYFFEENQRELSIDTLTGEADIYESLINQTLNILQQLGKVIILVSTNTTFIYFCISHVISDAKSSICFIENCLNHYTLLVQGKTPRAKALPLLADIGSIINEQVSQVSLFDFRMLHNSLANTKKLSPSNAEYKTQSQCHNRIKTLTFDSNELKRLRTLAKEYRTTLNGLISAAILFALKKMPTTQGKDFSLATAINLRQLLPKPITNEQLILAAYGQVTTIDALEETFEITAQKISNSIKASISSGTIFNMVFSYGLRKIVNPHQLDWHQNPSSVTISNIGNLTKNSCLDKITVKHVKFSVTRFDGQPFITMLTFDDTLHLNIAYPHPRYSDELIDRFISNILSLIP